MVDVETKENDSNTKNRLPIESMKNFLPRFSDVVSVCFGDG